MAKNKLNIAPVISPDILKTISASTIIKTFGDQLKNKAKETIIAVAKNKATELQASVSAIIEKEIKLGISHSVELKRLNILLKRKQITEEEYQKSVEAENISYQAELVLLNEEKQQLQNQISNILLDPYKQIKDKSKEFKNNIKKLRKKIQDAKNKAKIRLTKQVLSNTVKTLAPVIALQLANQFSSVISQRKKLEELVDQINVYIDTQVKDEQTVIIATNLRNNTVTLINNNIKKLKRLQEIIQPISFSITLFNILIPLLNRTAPLTVISVPPGVPILGIIPHDELRNKKQRLEKLVTALSAILAIATNLLSVEIIKLNELIERLKQISLKLDGKSLNNLSALTNFFLPTGTEFASYKGFNFKIKEEQDPRFVVKGNKRRYAVAINRSGIEQLKSEFSFTLDPNDLIEQLKLIIDQRNLQG